MRSPAYSDWRRKARPWVLEFLQAGAFAVAGHDVLGCESPEHDGRSGTQTMDRVGVFVDAGYLFAEGSRCLCGKRLSRTQVYLDHDAVVAFLKQRATQITGLPVLRIYWYDGALSTPNPAHVSLAYKSDVKLRLGQISGAKI